MKHLNVWLGSFLLTLVFTASIGHSSGLRFTVENSQKSTQTSCHSDIPAKSLGFSADGQYAIATTRVNPLHIWDTNTDSIVSILDSNKPARQFDISGDNKYIVTGDYISPAILWDVLSGHEVRTFSSKDHSLENIQWLTFSPVGHLVLITDVHEITLWDADSNSEPTVFSIPEESPSDATFSPDGTQILTSSQAKSGQYKVRLWDAKSAKVLYVFDDMISAQFSPNGKYIIADSYNDGAEIVDAVTLKRLYLLDPSLGNWRFSPNSNYLTAADGQEAVVLWDVQTGKVLHRFPVQTGIPFAVFLPNEQAILIGQDNDSGGQPPTSKTIYSVRDIKTGNEIRQVKTLPFIQDITMNISSPNGKYLLIDEAIPFPDTMQYTLSQWDLETGRQVRQYC